MFPVLNNCSFNQIIDQKQLHGFNLRSTCKVIGRGPKYKNLHDNYYEDDVFVNLKQLVKIFYESRLKTVPTTIGTVCEL